MELAQNSRTNQNGRNRWNNNRNKDNSSPSSQNSGGKPKQWINPKVFNGGEFRPNNGPRNGGMRNDVMPRNPRNNFQNGAYGFQNCQFQNGKTFQQQPFNHPNMYQPQMQSNGPQRYGMYYYQFYCLPLGEKVIT